MKYLWFLLTFFSCLQATAQFIPLDRKRHADSLEHAMRTDPSDSLKARAAYLLSEYWGKEDTTKARVYLAKGKELAGNSPYARALYQYYIGQLYFKTQPERSEQAYLRVDSIATAEGLKFKSAYALLAAAWHNYCVLQQMKDDTEAVFSVLRDKVIVYTRKAERYEQLPDLYASVGLLLDNELEYDKAATYFDQAIAMLDTVSIDNAQQAYILSLVASNYLARNKLEGARKYQARVKVLLRDFPESLYYMEYLLNEADYYSKRKLYKEALSRIDSGLALAKHIAGPYDVERFWNKQAEIFALQGRHREAKDMLLTIVQAPTTPFATTRMMYYQDLAKQYAKLGDFKEAYRWNQVYSDTNDSLNKAKLKEKIFQWETKFRTAESKLEIASLKSQKSAAQLAAKNNRLFNWVLGLGCLMLLLIAAFSVVYYREQKRSGIQAALNHKQQLKELEQQRELAVTKAVLEGEEGERRRMARDLHDGLGGMLASVKIHLSGWAAKLVEIPEEQDFHQVLEQLDGSVSELRRIARNMMPEALLKFGFEAALNDLSVFYTDNGVQVYFQPFELQKNNSQQIQVTIYRIVQELIANAVRHGCATRIVLQCIQQHKTFLITVEDNGIGFDQAILQEKEGMGLMNIRSRVSYYKGTMELITAKGEGTTIHIELCDY